ncbi:MAG: hypothetical protein RMI56_03210 [Sulfolobales archaeon]|nr:hypothetical protein [Sulfolobales archaeon]MDW8082789.1 hypothetical protein [Sulfolobales archaeon]
MDISKVWRALSKTEVPGFDIDVVSAGLVSRVRISRDGSRIAVFIDFTGSDPSCGFCKFINHTLMKTVVERIKESLHGSGFKEVSVVDASTGVEL